MHLERDFIQRRFIDNNDNNQKENAGFTFSDTIIMNLFNLSTKVRYSL